MYPIAIGESNFKNLIKGETYYIDKTMYIKDIIDNKSKVILITRPRRFGKTLNMSMLKYYFDIREKESGELFKGLKILKQDEKYTSKMNYYPCIYMTLNSVKSTTYDEMLIKLKKVVSEVYQEHRYLLESEKIYPEEKEKIEKNLFEKAEKTDIEYSIKELSKYLNRHYDKQVLLLVDEYDVPIQNAYVNGYYDDAIEFFKTFYGTTFKDNQYLEKTVVTGVSKESIFSGANNFKVYTVLDREFGDDFGITTEEMKQVITDFEIEDEEQEIKNWYDGYKIGDLDGIYNPWSILNYLTDRKLIPYWVNIKKFKYSKRKNRKVIKR